MKGLQLNGVPTGLSIESYISRFYAIQRGVVRPQYIGTEAVLQSMRIRGFDFLRAALTDPKIGQAFLEVIRTNKPLSPEREARFTAALLQQTGQFMANYQTEKRRVKDSTGVEATMSGLFLERPVALPGPMQRRREIFSEQIPAKQAPEFRIMLERN